MRRLINLLPFAFVVHNFEEAWTIYTPQFIVAVGLATLLGFAVVFWRGYRGWKYVVTAFVGALFLNVFFPHVLSAIWYGRYMPGLISAVVLILPLTSAILWKICKADWFPPRRFLLTILLGGASGIALVAAFQGAGYLFDAML
jgi:hypothetical protein